VLDIGQQAITRLEVLHRLGFLHRDVKPENLLFEAADKYNRVYLIDFGLAKKFVIGDTHIPNLQKKGLVGTARYASVNALLAKEQSRRDDMESLGYVLVYLLKGSLPWQGLNAGNMEEKKQLILKKKMETLPKNLCKDLPDAFSKYLEYVKSLEFEEEPDYNMLRNMFKSVQKKLKDLPIQKEIIEIPEQKNNKDNENPFKREALKLKNRDDTEEQKKTEETLPSSYGRDTLITPHFIKETVREKENNEDDINLSIDEGPTTVRFKNFVSPIPNSLRQKLILEKELSITEPYNCQLTDEADNNQSTQSTKNRPIVNKSKRDCTVF